MRVGPGAYNSQWVPQLPEHLVDSLRVLFDILDTSRGGLVSYEQIEDKWRDLPTGHLPAHFLESLRKVTPRNGMLSFERFLTGVRLSLQERRNYANLAKLYRVRSEGKLEDCENANSLSGRRSQTLHNTRTNGPPAMGLNGYGPRGLGEHNRLNGNYYHHYRSQPAGINHSEDQRSDSKSIGNGDLSNNANYSVVLRPKKVKNIRAPAPPGSGSVNGTPASTISLPNRAFRPLSTNSVGSACSSGMTEVLWRNSTRQSRNINGNNHSSPSPPSQCSSGPLPSYSEELQPQVVG
ncbi:suppressor APC domain-containing protein 2 [Ditylenchus destructor]|nr:suppressor APC domain-containing protein 2 [Ditylenchus destructor]